MQACSPPRFRPPRSLVLCFQTPHHVAPSLSARRIVPGVLLCCLALLAPLLSVVAQATSATATVAPSGSNSAISFGVTGASAAATPAATDSNSASSQDPYASNPFTFALDFYGGNGLEYTLSVILIIWGCILLVLGVRLFKISIFVLTWIVVGGLTYYCAMLASHGDAKKSFIAAMIIGLAFGILAVQLAVLGLILAGGFAAFLVWEVFLSLFPGAVANSGSYTILAIVVCAGMGVAWWFQRWVLLVCTPVVGAFFLSQGLSKYLHDPKWGINVFEVLHHQAVCTTGDCRGLVAGFAAVAATGFLIQYYFTSGLRSKNGRPLLPIGSPKSHY